MIPFAVDISFHLLCQILTVVKSRLKTRVPFACGLTFFLKKALPSTDIAFWVFMARLWSLYLSDTVYAQRKIKISLVKF